MMRENFIVIRNDSWYFVFTPDSGEDIFYTAATRLCMSDCTGDSLLMIVSDSDEYIYQGWQPGLVYSFYCEETQDLKIVRLDPDRFDH